MTAFSTGLSVSMNPEEYPRSTLRTKLAIANERLAIGVVLRPLGRRIRSLTHDSPAPFVASIPAAGSTSLTSFTVTGIGSAGVEDA